MAPSLCILFALLITLMAMCSGAPSAADQAAFDQFCVSKSGPGYYAVTDTKDDFLGCQLKPANPCFYGPYTDPKTLQPGCCGKPGLTFKFDPKSKEGACCAVGKDFIWDATTKIGACLTPTPAKPNPQPKPPAALVCPQANGSQRIVNGHNFKVYCQRAVRVNIPIYQLPSYWANMARNPPTPGVTTAEQCLDKCARDSTCEGANWINNRGCGIQNKGWGIFGNLYEDPPTANTQGYDIMAFVAVPIR